MKNIPNKIFLTLFLIFYCQNAFCQKFGNNNGAIIEVFGHTNGILSIGYERYIKPKNNNYFLVVLRSGIGVEPGYTGSDDKRYNQKTIVPVVVSLLVGKKNHYLQIGTGFSGAFNSGLYDANMNPPKSYPRFVGSYSFSVGYRLMTDDFSIQFFPVCTKENTNNSNIKLNIGMSIGFRW